MINGDMLMAGTQGGEVCLFSIYSQIYRATMPLSSNGLLSIALMDDKIFVGGGDGKVKKLSTAGGKWNLTHEAQLDGKVTSLTLSADKKELLAGTNLGKIYRLLSSDLSFMVHTDAHFACINDISFGGRSDVFATIDEGGIVKMWDGGEYKTTFTASGGNHVRQNGVQSGGFRGKRVVIKAGFGRWRKLNHVRDVNKTDGHTVRINHRKFADFSLRHQLNGRRQQSIRAGCCGLRSHH